MRCKITHCLRKKKKKSGKKEKNSNLYTYDTVLDLFDEVHLHHYPDQTKSRASYLPLLELRAKENPDDYYGLIYLAHEYYYRGKYESSIDTLDKVLDNFGDRLVKETSLALGN